MALSDCERRLLEYGVKAPSVLLPKVKTPSLWPVVACDQYTSEPEYWHRVEERVGNEPSTYSLILPELYLGGDDEAMRVGSIHEAMERYLCEGVLEDVGEGFVLVRRSLNGKVRLGLMALLDLERYDFSRDSASLIRATEGTIVERIPPRLRVREGAALELPHAIVLIDDVQKTLIEPLTKLAMRKLYDIELMEGGGRVEGFLVPPEASEGIAHALEALYETKKRQSPGAPMLFAVGDGNHSLATAKTAWEDMKDSVSADHPARFALVELENVHDGGIMFEAIHRVVFGIEPKAFFKELCAKFNAHYSFFEDEEEMTDALSEPYDGQIIPFVFEDGNGLLMIDKPLHSLACGSLQMALDALLQGDCGARIDYVHGGDVVKSLGRARGCVGFILPAIEKRELFSSVQSDGPMPRKAFSMGSAHEKRFYLEARRIL